MKTIYLFISIFFLLGCQNRIEGNVDSPLFQTIKLSNREGRDVGIAIQIKNDIFLTADHLLQKSTDLYHNNSKIKVIARDHPHDLLIFKIYNKDALMVNPLIKSMVNEDFELNNREGFNIFYWGTADNTKKLDFLRKEKTYNIEQEEKKDILIFSGIIAPGDSGSPFFDREGNIQGILIGANTDDDHALGISSEVISNFLSENVDE